VAAKKYPQEFKDACVQEVIRSSRSISIVAREQGVVQQTLRNWVSAYRKEHPQAESDLNVSEREKLKRLESENRELRARVEFLGKATAFFAKEYR
jgi:transposase